MRKKAVNVGDKIDMTHVKSATRRKLSENTYVSNVVEFDGWRNMKISAPIYEGRIIPVQANDEYDLCIYTSGELYHGRVRIVRRFREKKILVVETELLAPLEKYQRRQFFRLDCTMKMRYRIVSKEEKELRDFIAKSSFQDPEELEIYMQRLESYLGNWDRATLTDISGGGVRFQCAANINPDSILEVALPLKFGNKTISFHSLAKVVAVAHISFSGSEEIELRCEFYELEREKQELVVKFVFEEQRRRVRNKLSWKQKDDEKNDQD